MTAVFLLRKDPHAGARLCVDLQSTPRLRVSGHARQLSLAVEMLDADATDLLITDLRLADGSAVSLLHQLRQSTAAQPPRVLLLTPSLDDPLLIEALRAGADGYALENDPSRRIDVAIAETMRDEAVMAAPVARQVTAYFSTGGARLAPLKLSDADRELLMRLGRGQAPAEIARADGDEATASGVRRRIRQIYRKMQWDLRVAMQQAA